MKKITQIVLLMVIVLTTSCEKVIDITPKNASPEIMIEATLTDNASVVPTVKITKSVALNENNVFPTVSGALVNITDNLGNSVTLSETQSGVYTTSALVGVSGRTYYLNIDIDGKAYSSACTMPNKVNLDTVIIGSGFGPGSPNGKSIIPVYSDPIGRGNYYRFKLQKNNEPIKTIFLINDEIIDGGINNNPLVDQTLTLKTGDSVMVTMMCIDKAVNLYFYSMNQNGAGPDASATPANPITNINGVTLGYFSAHTIQTKKIIIP
jgi:hypothetical protein